MQAAREPAAILHDLVAIGRREFIAYGAGAIGWGAFAVVLGTGTVETVRFFFPRVLYHPPSTVRIGIPDDFAAAAAAGDAYGVLLVDERWKRGHRFFVVREPDRLYALSARCAHLGCTVNWFGDLHVFRCPCHGSEYRSNGVNFAGPAPRPLDRLRIARTTEGELLVDTAIVYEPDRQHMDGAFVRI